MAAKFLGSGRTLSLGLPLNELRLAPTSQLNGLCF